MNQKNPVNIDTDIVATDDEVIKDEDAESSNDDEEEYEEVGTDDENSPISSTPPTLMKQPPEPTNTATSSVENRKRSIATIDSSESSKRHKNSLEDSLGAFDGTFDWYQKSEISTLNKFGDLVSGVKQHFKASYTGISSLRQQLAESQMKVSIAEENKLNLIQKINSLENEIKELKKPKTTCSNCEKKIDAVIFCNKECNENYIRFVLIKFSVFCFL